MANTTKLDMPRISGNQNRKHVTHNEALDILDAVVQLSVKTRTLSAPPASPVDGDRYIVNSNPTGAWAGKAGFIAAYQNGAWRFIFPRVGWIVHVADENVLNLFNGTSYGPIPFYTTVYNPQGVSPANPVTGMVYFDFNLKKLRVYTGTAWENLN